MTSGFLYGYLLGAAMGLICPLVAPAQLPDYQLNRIQEEGGLKTADVINMARDSKGFLWLASQGHVHQFDGRHTLRFLFDETVNRLLIDARDRKWVITRAGIFLYSDLSRSFEQVFMEKADKKATANLYETMDGSVWAVAPGRHYVFNDAQCQFMLRDPPVLKKAYRYFGKYRHSLFWAHGDSASSYDQQTGEVISAKTGSYSNAVPLGHDKLLISTTRYKTFYADLRSNSIKLLGSDTKTKDTFGNKLIVFNGVEIRDGEFLVSSNKGLFQYNTKNGSITHPVFYYYGRPLENQRSVTSLYKDADGSLYMNHADGLFFLSNGKGFIQYLRNYSYGDEELPSNDVRNFTEDENGNIWMATINGIARLNMRTGEVKNFDPLDRKNMIDYPSYRQLLNDGPYIWIGSSGNGLWLYEKRTGVFKRPVFHGDDQSQKDAGTLNVAYVWKIVKLRNGRLLVVSGSYLFLIDPSTLVAQKIPFNMGGSVSRSAIQDSSGRIWHGTTVGLSCMDTAFNKYFRIRDSFPDKRVASFCEWRKDRMLVGSKGLFEVALRGNTIVSFNRKKAIPPDQLIYCMKQDRLGYVWLGTDQGLYRYDPVNDQATMFDWSDHAQSQAFHSDGAFLSAGGLMFMGGKNGVNYFNPADFSAAPESLRPMVLSFEGGTDNINFIISAPEFKKTHRIQYRYRLHKDDAKWMYTGFNNQVNISKLQPDDYYLQVSASYDGNTWFNGSEPVSFTVLKQWWQTWWFRLLCAAALVLAVWNVMIYRRKKREAAEIQRTIDYFTDNGSADASVNHILWDMARNCISRLGFEDCVIYLLDENKNTLVQKAAYGGKNPKAYEIANPLEIPVGKGITGHVAHTRTAAIINDTSRDDRYIVDDANRLSEITVPIIHEGKLIGVIDSEHTKRNFFTRHHLKALETISSLCASRIATAAAMESARKAESELLVLNGKMMESKFINLRLQMNPHFLFNILTTIQYLVVSNQVNKATTYLNIFSGFLRALLDYAEQAVVTLEEELRILKLYIELESLCLDETFAWEINVSDTIDAEEVLVPFMLFQPFIENAMHHGLIHKIGEKRFCITVDEHDEDSLLFIIEDNGIGRTASNAINRKKLHNALHQSKGIGIVRQRLELLQQKTLKKACFEIEDLYEKGSASGTRVKIIIPYYSNEEV